MYRKAKQAPEHKREACLIKELEDMLQKEGLSKNPSEKGVFFFGLNNRLFRETSVLCLLLFFI